ncbi:ubiquitin carboxyl-terminal hydrolase 43a [Electrophorus electricus]|uniref:ubiquitin carboxyl-terminal hydrolase 43a n=1 Tax=Electrophorus electricus TaxID=8005 RepID=UPI0015CFF35C|nr:ubiquitin carboxyl-terminal hydrolase 43a [Electrophorus electricus]
MCVAFCSPLRNMETSKQKEERAMNAKSAKDKKRKSPKAFRRTSLKSLGNFINKVLKTLGTLSQVGNVEQPDTEEDDGGFGDGAARALSAGSGKCKPDGRDDFKKSGTVSTQGPVRDRLSWPCGDKTPGVQGLKNHGNTCFMNAVIQCLSNTDLLAEHLGLEQYKAEQRRAHGLRQEGLQPAKGEVTERLASLVRALWTLEYTPQLSVDFKSVVSKYGSQFRGNSQHDALEFLLWLLDRVHEDANPSSTVSNGNNPSSTVSNSSNPSSTVSNGNNPSSTVTNGTSSSSRSKALNMGPAEARPAGTRHSFVQDHFQAQYRSSLTCPHCLKQSNTFDPFLCISLPIPLRQTRAVNVTVVFSSKALRYVRVGMAVPLLGSVSTLRAQLAHEGNINPEQVILVELHSGGFLRSFADDDDVASIAESDVVYAFQAPPPFSRGTSSRCSGFHHSLPSSPYTTGPEGQRLLASGTLSSEFLNQGGSSSVLMLICNTAGSGQHVTRFGPPFLIQEVRGVSWAELQQSILSKLYYLMLSGTPAQNAGVLFRIRVVGGSASCSYLSPHDNMPLCHPAVDRALRLCGPGGSLHIKLVIEWDSKVKERLFGSIQEEVVKDADSVRQQQHNHLQQHSCTLNECFQLYTKEEQLAPDDAWRCPHCKQLQQGVLKLSLWTLPDILILHLKRFRQVADRRNKLSTLVRFPPHGLDMAPHVAKRAHSSQHSLDPWPAAWEHGDTDFLYDLYAVCNHHGGMHGGHYTAYCRNSVDGQWYSYDDSSVDLVPEEELCTRGAYILFYQRRNAIPPWSASSSLRGSISSSMSEHWLVRLTEDSKRGSMASHISSSYPSPIPNLPELPIFYEDAPRNDSVSLGGFDVRPVVRVLQGRSASVRSPSKARDTLRKVLPLKWSFSFKSRHKPAPPAPAPAPAPAATPAPAQLVEYLESGRRPRCTNDNIITLMTSSLNKEAPEGQKATISGSVGHPDPPQVAEGQRRPASEPAMTQRGSGSGSLPRGSTRKPKPDQRSSGPGVPGLRNGWAALDQVESSGDDPKAQDSIAVYLRGGFVRRDEARVSGQGEPGPDAARRARSLPRASKRTNGMARTETCPRAEPTNGRVVGGRAGNIKRSQSSSSIPHRAEGDLRRSGVSGLPPQSVGAGRSPSAALQGARYSSSASLGRRRIVPESSF